ncbi:calcium/proton exchanger, partial [Tanacetum coccineum]
LKNALADYGVKHGYKLWYYRSDSNSLLVYCGRDVELGRCASRRGLIKKKKKKLAEESEKMEGNKVAEESANVKGKEVAEESDKVKGKEVAEESDKVKGKKVAEESDKVKGNKVAEESDKVKGKKVAEESDKVKGKKVAEEIDKVKGKKVGSPSSKKPWTRMRVQEHKGFHCPFRLWASWMSSETSFQIKSLYSDHRCSRDYNMGTLVTFRWIARHYASEIIMNPAITYNYMKDDIREKFMVDVSLSQCKRAKQCALYEHDGGLIEHYGKVWEYIQAILESNPGSACHIDVDLLVAMGRDGNNQMFPIAWAVVDIENINNWCWFLLLLVDDLELENGLALTVISDSHKGLIEVVRTWLP